jgi:hypothetical protein
MMCTQRKPGVMVQVEGCASSDVIGTYLEVPCLCRDRNAM